MTCHLVYVRGPRGPSPQKWFQGLADSQGKISDLVASYHPLTEEQSLWPIEDLMLAYPAPAPESD